MGSPLGPAVVNFYMEYIKVTAIRTVQQKLTHCFRYVNDSFAERPLGEDEL
jgi:hypothetical protein